LSNPTRPLPDHLLRLFEAGLRRRRQGPVGRYAPSPTGPLHRGNLSTALLSWLVTRLQGGEWLLRIDDLDRPRNRPGVAEAILADLDWLGLGWDRAPLLQSQRRGLYASTLSWLRRSGALYPCRCSRRLLADISAPHGAFAVYPGTCTGLDAAWGPIGGRLPSWRLRLPSGRLRWQDRLAPAGDLDGPSQVGDVVLRRADGLVAYHLATAVDELSLGISDVVRGHDLWPATAAQVAVMAVLGAPPRPTGMGPSCSMAAASAWPNAAAPKAYWPSGSRDSMARPWWGYWRRSWISYPGAAASARPNCWQNSRASPWPLLRA